ncbi:tRNA lysidine(34) synthetase TilS [Actinocorallia sp. API 0066]|uniref:tRNA lysidine(34) synthetase TilS n=1 Tax=Actinocorallia sp. API 0066 TaxID=2896846 RepID=UPI001E515314|nr:tRNA lysidine(34) synthetase TilS [Actinocorallia sp. API 0066]MCD0452298.1 tRNA lysidine(34) synthetase TilS [Actinocorallia sp. API 0066]
MGPDPAVARVRSAVRAELSELSRGALVLVACSGGADSLALAAALAFEAPRAGLRAGGVTVDHGLQEGSAARAARIVETLWGLGLDPAGSVAVEVGAKGGPEAAAREARYAALDKTAAEFGAAAVLVGHTRDDQAETVLLGLARGSGARSLAGMPARSGLYRRPLLGLGRAEVRRACLAMDLTPWDDPHNTDPAYTRSRVRASLLPAMEDTLGPGVTEALARTADLLRADAEALDEWAVRAQAEARGVGHTYEVSVLAGLPRAVRGRVLRRAAVEAGCPAGSLAAVHVTAMDRLVTAWHGQRGADLPGGIVAFRRYGKLHLGPAAAAGQGR